MFFLIYGEDTYRSRKALASTRERFSIARDQAGLNVRVFSARTDELAMVREEIFASPFLAERKMVILEGFLGLSESDQEELKEALEKKAESTIVVLFEAEGKEGLAKAALFPLLSSQKYSAEHAALSEMQARAFAAEEAAAAGTALASDAAVALLQLAGTDSWRLHTEIAKLASFAKAKGASAITASMVRELVRDDAEEGPAFGLLDACFAGDASGVARELAEAFAAGTHPLPLLSALTKQLRAVAIAQDMQRHGESSPAAIASALGMHAFPAGKAAAAARQIAPPRLRQLFDDAVRLDSRLKHSSADAEGELLTLALAAARAFQRQRA